MERMFEIIDLFFMAQTVRLQRAAKAFKEEERGASDMVAIMVLIVIIIAVATIFHERLGTIVGQILDRLGEFAGRQ